MCVGRPLFVDFSDTLYTLQTDTDYLCLFCYIYTTNSLDGMSPQEQKTNLFTVQYKYCSWSSGKVVCNSLEKIWVSKLRFLEWHKPTSWAPAIWVTVTLPCGTWGAKGIKKYIKLPTCWAMSIQVLFLWPCLFLLPSCIILGMLTS